MTSEWQQEIASFEVIDVRSLTTNFLPSILRKAQQVELHHGICIVQTFDPKPLYKTLQHLGFESYTQKVSNTEYRAYFYRTQCKSNKHDVPFKPTAILNFKVIDDHLADIVVDIWQQVWNKEDSAFDMKTKLLLSMSNAIGAHRHTQATRELMKAYSLGVTVDQLDELFTMFVWNQGIGNFSSEIGPSTVFGVYK